jgi:hypothetical protein
LNHLAKKTTPRISNGSSKDDSGTQGSNGYTSITNRQKEAYTKHMQYSKYSFSQLIPNTMPNAKIIKRSTDQNQS